MEYKKVNVSFDDNNSFFPFRAQNNNFEKNECAYCGESTKYELCRDCYQLSKENAIIKKENGKWIKNPVFGNEYKFYDSNKKYILKQEMLNEFEMRFFNIARKSLSMKYTIIPQVNLQTIISTDTNTRNDELYRNIDFMIFHSKTFIPFLAIELNGQQHYTNDYYIERDKSVAKILNIVELPLLTIDIKDLKKMKDEEIELLVKKVVKYLNPSFFARLFKKVNNKMDMTWAREYSQKPRIRIKY